MEKNIKLPTYREFENGSIYEYKFENTAGVEFELFIDEDSWLVLVNNDNNTVIKRYDFTEKNFNEVLEIIRSYNGES